MSGRPTEKLDIGALLDEASRANEALRSAAPHTEKAAERPPETPSEAKLGGAPAPDITSELISRYSERVKEPDPRSSTQSLRDSLHAHMEGDRELLAYYSGRSEHRSGKVDELYEIIKSAKSATESDARVRPVPHDASRFQDASEVELPERAEQGKLFPLTETIELGDAAQEQTPSYDEDYAKLSEKIEKGELDFAEETENEGQISIVDELWPDELKAGSTRAIDEELKSVFGMLDEDHYADPDGPDPKQKKREKRPPREEPADAFEYTSREQNAEIGSMLKKAVKQSRLRLAGVLFFALATLYLALAAPDSAIHSDFLRPGRYGIVYILVDLQVLLFIAALSLSSIKSGAKALFTWRPTSDSVLFFTFAVSIAYSLLAAFIAPTSESFVPFSLFAAAAAVCAAAVNYLRCKKDLHCFRVVASKNPKYVAARLSGGTAEADEFYKYLLDDSGLYTVRRAGFVGGFFARMRRRPQSEDLFKLVIPAVFLAGAVLFGLRLYDGDDFFTALTAFVRVVATATPLTAFFIISLPVIAANRVGKRCSSALVGNAVGEEYADASVISFADTEVYPSNLVKITSIKTYGDYRIDMAVSDLARAFSFIGGPLAKVISNMLSEPAQPVENARVIESAADGVCIVLDGVEMFLGKRGYMKRCRFGAPRDVGDDEYEDTVGSVMYMAIGDALVAKVYVRYSINPQFNDLLRDLYRAGMCVGIKTLDPNISNELLARGVTFNKCPIAILKAGGAEQAGEREETVDSGIVTNASMHTFLKMFILCDKVRHVTKSNGVIHILSVLLSLFVAFFLTFTGAGAQLGPVFAVLFQALWLIPIWLTSRLI